MIRKRTDDALTQCQLDGDIRLRDLGPVGLAAHLGVTPEGAEGETVRDVRELERETQDVVGPHSSISTPSKRRMMSLGWMVRMTSSRRTHNGMLCPWPACPMRQMRTSPLESMPMIWRE